MMMMMIIIIIIIKAKPSSDPFVVSVLKILAKSASRCKTLALAFATKHKTRTSEEKERENQKCVKRKSRLRVNALRLGGKHRHLCNETAWEVKAVEHVEHHQPAPDGGVDEVVPIGAQNHCKQQKKGGVALNYIAQNQETVVNLRASVP